MIIVSEGGGEEDRGWPSGRVGPFFSGSGLALQVQVGPSVLGLEGQLCVIKKIMRNTIKTYENKEIGLALRVGVGPSGRGSPGPSSCVFL